MVSAYRAGPSFVGAPVNKSRDGARIQGDDDLAAIYCRWFASLSRICYSYVVAFVPEQKSDYSKVFFFVVVIFLFLYYNTALFLKLLAEKSMSTPVPGVPYSHG